MDTDYAYKRTMEQPKLETGRLLLRPFETEDKFTVQSLAGNKSISDNTLTLPHPYTLEMAEKWIASHEHDWKTKARVTYAIVSNDKNTLLGAISLVEIKGVEAKLGYWVGEPYWNKGVCTEAVTAVLKFAFSDLNMQKVYAEHLSTNPASGRVMQNNGMRHVAREKAPGRNNTVVDVEIYEISCA